MGTSLSFSFLCHAAQVSFIVLKNQPHWERYVMDIVFVGFFFLHILGFLFCEGCVRVWNCKESEYTTVWIHGPASHLEF